MSADAGVIIKEGVQTKGALWQVTGLSGWSCCVVNQVLDKISRREGGSPFGSQVYEGSEQEDGWLIPATNKERFTGNRDRKSVV